MVQGHLRPSQHGAHYLASWSLKVPRTLRMASRSPFSSARARAASGQKDAQRGFHTPGNAARRDSFHFAYMRITRSMARRQTAQKPTSSRVNMMQSCCGR